MIRASLFCCLLMQISGSTSGFRVGVESGIILVNVLTINDLNFNALPVCFRFLRADCSNTSGFLVLILVDTYVILGFMVQR